MTKPVQFDGEPESDLPEYDFIGVDLAGGPDTTVRAHYDFGLKNPAGHARITAVTHESFSPGFWFFA